MQFWPRSRAADVVARVRSWPSMKDQKLAGFAGYKVGMTHVLVKDNIATSISKGDEIQVPVTVIECPPVKVASVLLFSKDAYGERCVSQLNAEKLDKQLSRKMILQKKPVKHSDVKNVTDVRVLVHTQPWLSGLGKKTPEVFELGVGGQKLDDRITFAKSLLGKDVKVSDVFGEGQLVDSVSITKGKGLQGPVKRFHIALRSHKSEKTKRGPGSLGPWHGFRGFRTPHAGQTGFQQRMEHNKYILRVSDDVKKVNVKGGFVRYGLVKAQYLLIRGSVGGASKRLVTLTAARRGHLVKLPKEAPEITYTSLASKQ